MSVRDLIMSAAGAEVKRVYPEDVFSANLYTGNDATNKIVNKLDLAGRGGFTLFKDRILNGRDPLLIDTTMPYTGCNLWTDDTAALQPGDGTPGRDLVSFDSDGFTLGPSYNMNINAAGKSHVAWCFKKDPKFFNMVTWTGDGVAGRNISTGLSVPKGLVIVKRLDAESPWAVYNSDTDFRLFLNTTDAQKQTAALPNGSVTYGNDAYSFALTAGTSLADVNTVGGKYIAYVFGDDDTVNSVIKTGSYTGNGSATGPVINLGWEPQFVLIKNGTGTGNWQMFDTSRGIVTGGTDKLLKANIYDNEINIDVLDLTSTGFQIKNSGADSNTNGATYIYMAIRRPCKPPVDGTEVYKAIVRTGTGAATTLTGVGFKPDMFTLFDRKGTQTSDKGIMDRLRGDAISFSNGQAGELTAASQGGAFSWGMDGFSVAANNPYLTASSTAYVNHFFKRAPGFFDIVTYTGNSVARDLSHSLEAIPELIIFKCRNNGSNWVVWDKFDKALGKFLLLNSNQPANYLPADWFSIDPTEKLFSLGSNASVSSDYYVNQTGYTYVAYMFATLKGVSKVGTYIGSGTSQTIDCGFTTGARFFMVKAMDSTADWYVWDTVRGIIVGNDPYVTLNGVFDAEVTNTDYVDPATVGFIAKAGINNLSNNYLYLAIA